MDLGKRPVLASFRELPAKALGGQRRSPAILLWIGAIVVSACLGLTVATASEALLRLLFVFVFIALGLASLRLAQILYGDIFAPLSIYLATWLVTFAAFCLQLVEYVDVSLRTWLILFGSLVTFTLGCLVVTGVRAERSESRQQTTTGQPSPRRFRVVVVALFALASVGSVANIVRNVRLFGWQTILTGPFRVRKAFTEGEIRELYQFLTFLNEVVIIMCAYYFFAYPRRRSRLMLMLPLASMGYLLTTTGRTRPIFALIACFGVWLSLRRNRAISFALVKRLVLLLILLLAVFNLFGQWLGKTFENSEVYQRGYVQFEPGAEFIALPYVYLTGNIAGFDVLVEQGPEWTYGAASFRPVLRVLSLFDPNIKVPRTIEEFESIPFRYNTATYLSTFYRDFGIAGVLIAPFVLGMITTLVYQRTRQRPTFFVCFWWGVLFFGLVNSVFVNQITQPAPTYVTAVAFIVAASMKLKSVPIPRGISESHMPGDTLPPRRR